MYPSLSPEMNTRGSSVTHTRAHTYDAVQYSITALLDKKAENSLSLIFFFYAGGRKTAPYMPLQHERASCLWPGQTGERVVEERKNPTLSISSVV